MRIFHSCLAMASLSLLATASQAKVTPAAWVASGMVLQRGQVVTLSGTADPGESFTASFIGKRPAADNGKSVKQQFSATADANGAWSLPLPAMRPGGPYELQLADLTLSDILIGDVYLCSGQSNMELPVCRVMDRYAQEINANDDNNIRLLKVKTSTAFTGPAPDVQTDGWKHLNKANAYEFSAIGYFFAREMQAATNIPIGIIESAVGGSPIEAWISREELLSRGANSILAKADMNADPDYRATVEQYSKVTGDRWELLLAQKEAALAQDWKAESYDDSAWQTVDALSDAWTKDATRPLNGAHWFRKSITITDAQAAQPATLRLGMLIDADEVWVNGRKVGQTYYQYPPRIYDIPQGTLHAGNNTIAIRLTSQNGQPRFVADMYRGIFFGSNRWLCGNHADKLDLDNNWRHLYAAAMPQKGGVEPFIYTPTALYNAMIAPLKGIALTGALWYQGESNVGRDVEYRDLLNGLFANWRTLFQKPDLNFIVIGLADFEKPVTTWWRALQKAQQEVAEADPHAAFAPAADLGVWYDVHPLDKKTVAVRAARAMKKLINIK